MYPITFVSLGPGEAELITLKGLKALQSADCIYYPATISKEGTVSSRALDIMSELDVDTEKGIPFHVPMSKDRTKAIAAYANVAKDTERQYKDSKKVAIVAEGDAGFYSSIHYIFETLEQDGIPVNRVAGVPAFIAAGALAGIHVVKLEEELNVVPGIISSDELTEKINLGKVIVIMKVSLCADAIKECIGNNKNAIFHYFENVGVKDLEYYTTDIQEIINRKIPYFSLMIIQGNPL